MEQQKNIEHTDLEEKFQIAADIEFTFERKEFEGLNPLEIKIKKKQEPKTVVQNVKLRESTGGLF
jgi:hypothetical protein